MSYAAHGVWAQGYSTENAGITLTADGCEQRNTSTDGPVVQPHVLTGVGCAQANACTSGAINGSTAVILVGSDVAQFNDCTGGAIVQVNLVYDFWLQPGAGKTWTPPNPLRP